MGLYGSSDIQLGTILPAQGTYGKVRRQLWLPLLGVGATSI